MRENKIGGSEPERHVVLVAPEIHWNTGNIGRTCLGAGARLHLIRPLGFSLDSRQVKRAGLDYWDRVAPDVWDSFDAFCHALNPREAEVALLTKSGSRIFWEMSVSRRMFLVFGSETGGLPDAVLDGEFICHSVHISGSPTFRSLINGSYYSIAPSSMRFVEYRQVAGKPILPIQEQQS